MENPAATTATKGRPQATTNVHDTARFIHQAKTRLHNQPIFTPLTRQRKRSPEVVIEPLERVPNKRQAHLGALLLLARGGTTSGAAGLGGLEHGGVVRLVNLVGREVGRVDVGRQARLERRADPPQAVELDATEEGVALDLVRAAAAEPVLRVADQAR
jgi:hypothetical protein